MSRRGGPRLDQNDRLAVLHHRADHGGKADRAATEDRNRRAGGAGQRTHDAASTGLKAAAQRAEQFQRHIVCRDSHEVARHVSG